MPRINPAPFIRLAAWPLLAIFFVVMPSCAAFQSLGDEANATRHYQQGLAYFAADDVAQAMAQFEMAQRKDAGMYQAYYYLGLTYKHLDLPKKAKETWLRGLKLARASYDRRDYPKMRAIAEMEAGLSSLDPVAAKASPAPLPRDVQQIIPDMMRSKKPPTGRMLKGLPPAVAGPFAVLYSSNLSAANARKDQLIIQSWGFKAKVLPLRDNQGRTWHRVLINCCTDRLGAMATVKRLNAKGVNRKLLVVKLPR